MILVKSYKIFFITLLIAGGFLLLVNVNNVLAVAIDLEAGPCGGDCPDDQICNVVTDSCEAVEETDACGGMCVGEDVCNEATGECVGQEGSGGACGGDCPDGQVCNLGTDTCEAVDGATGGDSRSDNQLPTGDTRSGNINPVGPGRVQLPNFLGSGVTSIKDLIFKIVAFLIDIAKYFAALMLVWAGFLFVTAQGDPAKLTKAKQNFLWTVAGIAVILASDAIVTYIMEVLGVTGAGAGSALLNKIKATLTQVVALLFVLVTLYFGWGIVEFVRASASGDSAKLESGKKHMIWGIVGMAVMLGAWGIVEMIRAFVM